jgi:hypothetical protein
VQCTSASHSLPDDAAAAHPDYERVTARTVAELEKRRAPMGMIQPRKSSTWAPSAPFVTRVFFAGERTDLRSDYTRTKGGREWNRRPPYYAFYELATMPTGPDKRNAVREDLTIGSSQIPDTPSSGRYPPSGQHCSDWILWKGSAGKRAGISREDEAGPVIGMFEAWT